MQKYAVVILFISIALISLLDFFGEKNILTGTISNIVWAMCMVPFLYAAFILCTDFHFENLYIKYAFYLFLIYQFVIFIRGALDTNDFLSIIRQGPILWALFVPFFIFFNKSFYNIRKIFDILFAFAVIFLIVNLVFPSFLLNRQNAETFISTFAIGSGFLFLNSKYLSNKKIYLSFFVVLISALSYIYLARRSAALTMSGFIIAGFIFSIINKSSKAVYNLTTVFVIGIALLFLIPNSFSSSLLRKMDERLLEDTRTGLFDEFYKEMDSHKLFGKGMDGTYYYPMGETVQDDGTVYGEVVYRNIIENGYLQLYLSGGILHLILFVLILLPASILGIFKSSNAFTRICGVMILLWLIDMFFYGLPTLSIHYILIWICAGVCFKKSIRDQSESEVFNKLRTSLGESRLPNLRSRPIAKIR